MYGHEFGVRGRRRAAAARFSGLVVAWSLATAASTTAPANAQSPQPFLLDHFEVVHTEDVQREVETRRYTTAANNLDAFPFGGTKVYTGTFPTGKLIATATLSIELPDKITPGVPFQIGGGATGQLDLPGRTGQTAVQLVAYDECYLQTVCSGALKSHYVDDAEGKNTSLAAPLAPIQGTLPVDPQNWPPIHTVMFRGGIGTTTPGDPYWRVYVYAIYKRPENVPTPVPSYRLAVDADATRLPPSGATPSEAAVTATMDDGAGKPVAGEALSFALDPPDMGSLATTSGVTDAAGEVRVRYRAPKVDALNGRDSVAVVVTNAARSLVRRLDLRIERYQLQLTVDPSDIPIEPVWRAVRVTAEVKDFDGKPVVGDSLQFRVDPPDMGTVIGSTMIGGKASTDAGGRVEGFYEPPPPSQLQSRDRATIYAVNLTHGGEAGVGVRFLGLKVIRTFPDADARDVELEPGDTVDIEFDRPLDPSSVNAQTVKLETLWHGNLGAEVTSFGRTAQIRVTADPVPDVGLRVRVTVMGGEQGVKARDGAVMAGPHDLWFRTMPRFDPKIIVSQVVDNPRDPLYGFITLAVKTFALRVEAGISADSELEDERVAVRLLIPRRGTDLTLQQTFYPGRWPPKVPEAVAKKGNSANFIVPAPFGRGGYTFKAELRPAFARPEKIVTVPSVEANVNSWSDVGAARKIGMLAVPIVNDLIPGSEWKVSRGQQEQWLLGLAQPAVNVMPLTRLDLRLSYLADTTCIDPDKCRAHQPWTTFLYWAKDLGRTGFATRVFGWRYVVALVPPNYFDRFADHPDVLANPGMYHDAIQSGIWSQKASAEGARVERSAFPISIMEVGVSPEALVHVLGDVEGLADSSADRDDLSGYDLLNDRVMYSDAEHTMGASRAVMNLGVGFGATWPATHDHEAFMDLWTQRSCFGQPPCPPRFVAAAGDGGGAVARAVAHASDASFGSGAAGDGGVAGGADATAAAARTAAVAAAAANPVPVPVVLVSGTIRRRANGVESASIDPLVTADGAPTLDPAGTGDHGIELRDAAGARIARYAFTPAFGPVDDGALAGFLVAAPAATTAASVAILAGDTVIAQRTRSAHAPTVRFTQPQAGATRRGDVDVAWAGDDADGDALTYSLQFGGDGGQRWEPLLMDSRLTRYTLPSALVGNGPGARLRVMAMDGFDAGEATVTFGLDNPLTVLAVDPPDGAKDVAVRGIVQGKLRDALDAASVDGASLALVPIAGAGTVDGAGGGQGGAAAGPVVGDVGYEALDRTLVFTPTLELAEATTYEARLSARVRTADGRTLPGDHVWTFTTRGRTVYLPWSNRTGNVAQRTATPRPTRTAGPSPTHGPTPTAAPSLTAAPTPDAIGTRVA
ncbi:MAG: Ig-like domain-containing protein, partial [Ardenticatenales bacterium]